jgi:sigma-B regulation protein RsbU (phosphoserine phosphatase)
MFAGVVVWFIDWVFVVGDRLFGSRMLKNIVDVASALAFIPLIYFLIKGARWVTENLLWRVRRRLIVTYLLIGALPFLLVLVLVTLILLAVAWQSSVNLVGRQLDGYFEQSQAAARALSRDLNGLDPESLQPGRKHDEFRGQLQESADSLAPVFPDLTLSVRLERDDKSKVTVRGRSSERGVPNRSSIVSLASNSALPEWLLTRLGGGGEFHGLIVEENAQRERRVFVRHVIKLAQPASAVFQLSYPLAEDLCEHLRHTTELDVKPATASFPLMMTASGPQPDTERLEKMGGGAQTGGVPIFKQITEWRTGETMENEALKVDASFILPSRIYNRVQQFKSGSAFGSAVVMGVGVSIAFFLLMALMAVVSAIVLTRSITGAVHNLYQGTKRVEAGDFDHEIPIAGNDQLGDLSRSFNQMAGSIRELLHVSAEKRRLDQEMEFAAAVQARLFPRTIPNSEKLDIVKGVCIPARSVSGDYYDLIDVTPGVIAVVVADVCGKGVSAALMMANLQANLRGQVQTKRDAFDYRFGLAARSELGDGAFQPGGSGSSYLHTAPHSVKRIVERINHQVAESVMDASYITLFYAEYDEMHSTLRYSNAGHNPPLVVRAGGSGVNYSVEKLDCGGTVLGLFRDAVFEEAELKLESGDLLVAFTDGVIEAHDPRGEEFGEDRLIDTLLKHRHQPAAQIQSRILQTVEDWTADAEQEDDVTLVILKVK